MSILSFIGIGKKAVNAISGAEEQKSDVATISQEVGSTIRAFSSKEQGTKRLSLDMLSDSKLSKAVRPITIIWFLALFSLSLVASWFGKETPEQFQELIFWGLIICIGFYFPGRDLVKTFANRKGGKK